MLTKEAIQELSEVESISAAQKVVENALGEGAIVALPSHFSIVDLEKYLPGRRRARGVMSTHIVDDFASYTKCYAEEGAAIFINPKNMDATAILNFGTKEKPGHADNKACLKLQQTAEFTALKNVAAGQGLGQKSIAEFFEDWRDFVSFYLDDGSEIEVAQGISAMRAITIETIRKLESVEKQLSSSKSDFESIQASSKEWLPTIIKFACVPYVDLSERSFYMRLGVLTGGNLPALNLRIIKMEKHEEQIAEELAHLIVRHIDDPDSRVTLGIYNV